MKKYSPYIKKYLYCFIFAPVFMTLEACGEFILPFLNADIIDKGAANGDIAYILSKGIIMVLIAAFMLVAGVLGAKFAVTGSARLAEGVRGDVFSKIQFFSFSDIDDFTSGSLITRITNDITQIQGFCQTLLRGFFRSPVMIIGALFMSFSMDRELSWILFIVVQILAAATFLIIKTAAPRYNEMQKRLDALNTGISEAITNERVIKAFVREEHEKKKFLSLNGALMEKSVRALKMMIIMQPVSALAINVTTLLVVWFAGRRIMVGDMEIGTLTAFITYLSQVLTALNFLAMIFLQGTRAAASDKRVEEVLSRKSSISDENAAYPEREPKSGSVEFKNVYFKYFSADPDHVLSDISFSIASGETVGLIGATGSGKTSLISLIPRLYDATEGEVLVDGVNVCGYSEKNLRKAISVVLQKNTLFSGTVKENLLWGNEDAGDEEIKEAARMACADEFISSFPEGYDTELSEGGVNLSGGQKQRLCIARALLKKPKILILDDSTSAVDTATDKKIRHALSTGLPGVTKIIIAQRIASVIDADKIIVLSGGRIAGIGRHSQLISSCSEYRDIYYSQKDSGEESA